MLSFISYNLLLLPTQVAYGSTEHIMPIVISVVLGAVLIYFAKNKLNKRAQNIIFNFIGFFIAGIVVVYHIRLALTTDYLISRDLPLFLCSLLALLIPFLTYYRKYWMYEIMVFWVLAFTTQAIVTPELFESFPSFEYFRYWIVHSGLIIVILYATLVYNYRPTLISIAKSMLALQVYIAIIYVVNLSLGANYSYLMGKPTTSSILDYFGDWPYYIFYVQLVLIPYFLLIYLPFYIAGRIEKRK